MQDFYLKPSIKIEPVIWQWYAWAYLIPPMTAACNIAERHLKIMQSYLQNPQIHAQAVKDPKLLGGPFIDLDGQKTQEIKDLIEKTKQNCQVLLDLNHDFKEFDKILQSEGQGDSLEKLYQGVPPTLQGMIELVYDLNNHPTVRLIEPFIYKKYYSDNYQGLVLSEMKSDFRKFVLSTPYLNQPDKIHLEVPFSSLQLDKLSKMREIPEKLQTIKGIFNIPSDKESLFESFFTTIPPVIPKCRNYIGEGVRLRYFGHACILIQTKSVSVLFDPVISYPLQGSDVPRYTFLDLPDYIDYVIITHNHQDHLMFEYLLQLRHKIGHIVFPANQSGFLADPSIKFILKSIGFKSLIELKELESISLPDGEIIAFPFLGEHSDLNIQTKLSYYIQIKNSKFLFAADSNNIESTLYEHIFDMIGAVDMLFLGMECDGAPLTWLYGPLLTYPLKRGYDKNRNLSGSNFQKAFGILEKMKAKTAYIYAMGQEPWLGYLMALKYSADSPQIIESNKFIEYCTQRGIESERLFGKKEWIIF